MSTPPSYYYRDLFRAARERVEAHMGVFEERGGSWKEETVTDLLMEACAPGLEFKTFSRDEESKNGADWIWWWIDGRGEAFGMLVQAKRLTADRTIAFNYDKGAQREKLIATAESLGVPAVHALYLGTVRSRGGRYCRFERHSDPCDYCVPATVSMISSLLTDQGGGKKAATAAIRASTPLEWMTDPAMNPIEWIPLWDSLTSDFRAFLSLPQLGARAVARHILDPQVDREVAELQHLNPGPEPRPAPVDDQLFTERLGDPRLSFLQPTLRGLRSRAPDYAIQTLFGIEIESPPEGVDGVVVVNLGPEQRRS